MGILYGEPTHEDIAIAAYYLWQKETYFAIRHGRTVEMDPVGDWYRGEAELRNRMWHKGQPE